jgi:hypothetical protein
VFRLLTETVSAGIRKRAPLTHICGAMVEFNRLFELFGYMRIFLVYITGRIVYIAGINM